MRSSLKSAEERLQINQSLIRLNGAACMPFSLEQLAYSYGGETTGAVLKAIGVK